MIALEAALLVFVACLVIVLAVAVVPWFVMAWRELGETEARHRKRPQIPRMEPWEPPSLPGTADSTQVDLPALACLQEAWVQETMAMIEERSA